jgi:hypothetical protein
MPLSPSVERKHLHRRAIQIDGYEREDGLFDIEAHLRDTKSEAFETEHRGRVEPGGPVHDMWVRLTVNDGMEIVAAEACTDHGPYSVCPGGAASYARLVGLRIRPGFLKEANARMAGPAGCTHLREMLQEIATTALQTLWSVKQRRRAAAGRRQDDEGEVRMLDTCHAYAADGPVARQRWPHLYTGARTGELASEASRFG